MPYSRHQDYISHLPTDWERVQIKDLGTVCAGGTPSRENDHYWNGHIQWVTPAEITSLNSKYLDKTRDHLTEKGLSFSAAKLLPPNSLLVTTRATIGAVAISRTEICTNQGFKNIVPNDKTVVEFYYHLFTLINAELHRLASGSTFLEINQRNFKSIVVPRPKSEEQRRIAEILDTIDEAIQRAEQLVSKLKAIKQGLLHDLLTRGLDENGQLRDTIVHPEQFKDSPLGKIPQKWRLTFLGRIARIRRGASPRPIDSAEWFANKGVGWVRISDVTKAIDRLTETEQYLSPSGEKKSVRVYPGQIIMSICATIGEPIILGMDACIHDGFVIFDQHEQSAEAGFLVRFLRYKQDYFKSQGQTGTQANLNTNIVKDCIIAVPPKEEQRAICETMDYYDTLFNSESKYLTKLKLLKKGLMHDLLTGRVRVNTNKQEHKHEDIDHS